MEVLVSFLFVRTTHSRALYRELRQLSGITRSFRQRVIPALEVLDNLPECPVPSCLIVSKMPDDWFCIRMNGCVPLYEWMAQLSQALNTSCVQATYRERDGFTCFVAYEEGRKKREIQATGASEIPFLNDGILFPFEDPHADGVCGSQIRLFELEALMDYCRGCGIDTDNLQLFYDCYVFRK